MCLTKLNHGSVPDEGEGYQVFIKVDGGLRPLHKSWEYITMSNRHHVPIEEWETDVSEAMIKIDYSNKEYPTGFHIFENYEDAFSYCFPGVEEIRKVHYKQVVAYGMQEICSSDGGEEYIEANVIVAKQRFICKESY